MSNLTKLYKENSDEESDASKNMRYEVLFTYLSKIGASKILDFGAGRGLFLNFLHQRKYKINSYKLFDIRYTYDLELVKSVDNLISSVNEPASIISGLVENFELCIINTVFQDFDTLSSVKSALDILLTISDAIIIIFRYTESIKNNDMLMVNPLDITKYALDRGLKTTIFQFPDAHLKDNYFTHLEKR